MSVTLTRNKELNGIELKFSKKPEPEILKQLQEKKSGFRWHPKKKIWYAKETPERLALACKLAGQPVPEPTEPPAEKAGEQVNAPTQENKPNTIAAYYSQVGHSDILELSNISLFDRTDVYFQEENFHFRRTYGGDSMIVTELDNAGKVGKTCRSWHMTPEKWGEHVDCAVFNNSEIHTCKALLQALRDGRELQGVKVREENHKGIDVFSPFVEVKPLTKLPEKWTKQNFVKALQSGQIYFGDTSASMAWLTKSATEGWYKTDSVYTKDSDETGLTATLKYSSGKHYETLLFDLNCDLAEGLRRNQERLEGIKQYNQMLEESCILKRPEEIDPNKIYTVIELEPSANKTQLYQTKTRSIQGFKLRDLLELSDGDANLISVNEKEIEPTRLYSVASFFHRWPDGMDIDQRMISCGNFQHLVTGKALLELTSEGISCPTVEEARNDFCTVEMARNTLTKFAKGSSWWSVDNADYDLSLQRLEAEVKRATAHHSLDSLISAAETSQANQNPSAPNKIIPFPSR